MKNEKFNEILHNALQEQKEMEKREKLYKENKMNDLISRQAAIDAIEITSFDDYGDYMRAKELIEALPSAQPHWIPCSERLPKSGEQVFVYLFEDSPYIAWYSDRDEKWHTNDFTLNADEEPKEWLPLPDPHKGE